MHQAESVHSTQRSSFHRIATPEHADDLAGMAWWNALSEQDRRRWTRIAGDTGRAVDAWRAFKAATGRDPEKAAQNERDWRYGYNAAFAAKMAGKPTPQAPRGVDGLSYQAGAVEGRAAAERELDPKDVLTDLFVEEMHPDAAWLAEMVIKRLRDSGFEIRPADDYPKTGRGA